MAGLQLGGLVSGMDTDTIITQLLSLERAPERRWGFDKVAAQTRQSALRDVETRLKSLKTAADDLGSTLSWSPMQTVESADSTRVGARMTGGAAPGGYSVKVTQMATSAQQTFVWTPQPTASAITISGVSVNIDPDADIDSAASAINSNSQLGVYAINVGNGKLVLSSRTTGTSSDFTVTAAGLGAPVSTRAGQNAILDINGVTQPEQQSNVVKDLIPGVELTLKGLGDGTVVNVSNPGVDRDALKAKMKAFVNAYNDVVDFVTSKTGEKRVSNPANNADAAKGVLFGDTGLNGILSSLRIAVGSPVQGMTGAGSLLSSIGISTGATTGANATNADSLKGRLTFDEAAFDAAVDKDPQSVQKLLGGVAGTDGFSQGFKKLLDPLVTTNGILDQRIDSAGKEIERIGDKTTRLEDRLTAREALLRKQFTAMETAMQRGQQQMADLASRLGTGS
jgi:flagellar hook-associated protein 2